MKTQTSKLATVAAFLGISVCASETPSAQESAPFDAASVLRWTPPVFLELDATNMMKCPPTTSHSNSPPSQYHTPPPPPPPPPKVHAPTPPANNAAARAAIAQAAAIQMANRQFQFQTERIAVYAASKLQ